MSKGSAMLSVVTAAMVERSQHRAHASSSVITATNSAISAANAN